MPIYIEDEAFEESSFIFDIDFYDEDKDSVIPKTLTWTLTDTSGNVINSREDVVVTPAAQVNIILSGDDLAITGNSDEIRVITIEATYDSDIGSDIPIKEDYSFKINNIRSI